MEAFSLAMNNAPNHEGVVTLNFVKQNVQVNIGCNFNYNVKRARRIASEVPLKISKNVFFPELLTQWHTMTEENKLFWRNELRNKGIIEDPLVSSGKTGLIRKFFEKLWTVVRQMFSLR
jgi:hypothetical protein